MARAPGVIRDAIVQFLKRAGGDATIAEIRAAVEKDIGPVPASSVRSYLGNNTPEVFTRTGTGKYRLNEDAR